MLSKSCNTTKALQRHTTKSKKGKGTKKATKSQKRAATESGDDFKSESGDEPTVKSRKKAQVTKGNKSNEEVEEIDDVVTVSPPEEISDDEVVNSANENGVSQKKITQGNP